MTTHPTKDSPATESAERSIAPSDDFLRLIPHEFARRHLVLSAGFRDGAEDVLCAGGTRPTALFNVGVRLGRPVRSRAAPAEVIAASIDRAYAAATPHGPGPGKAGADPAGSSFDTPVVIVEGSSDLEGDLQAALREAESDVLSTHGKSPAVRLVDLLLFEALVRDASDVHIQPLRGRTLVRYRLDGALHTVRELPGSLAAALISRIKVMGRLDVAEHRSPQDGRASVTVGGSGGSGAAGEGGPDAGRRVDLRISTLPSTYGERVVVRILDPARSPHLLSFTALGMPADVESRYLAQVARTSGIVLSTGPTGSGKTTTLYATLTWLSATNAGGLARGCELNIMTVEDPVEYDLSGTAPQATGARQERALGEGDRRRGDRGGGAKGLSVSQTQVDPKKNVTFTTGLRHILRQDPDVIMVGEVRDQETARMAVQASLTGHLVLSTLHTSDAASAIARLLDLGVEPFLVSSSLSAVLAQRLIRKVHAPCGGKGCAACLDTGYKGRTGVFELLVMDTAVREMVGRRCSAEEIKAAAQRAGMVSLRDAGSTLVRNGVTTAQEVARVIEAPDEVRT